MTRSLITTVILLFLFQTACGGPQRDGPGGGMRIIIEEPPLPQLALFGGITLSDPPLSIFSPTTTADFTCFGANVTGPGIVGSGHVGCSSTNNYNTKGPGAFSNLAPRGSPLTVSVSSGNSRSIDVYGVYPAPPECGGAATGASPSEGYVLGSKTVDVTNDTSVTIPVSFTNGTVASMTCAPMGSGGTVLNLTAAGTSACVVYTAPPTSPAPTGTVAGTVFSGPEVIEAQTENGTKVVKECVSASAAEMEFIEYQFDATAAGITLSNFSGFRLIWKGLAGNYTGTCTSAATLGAAGGIVFLYNYDNGTSPSWINVGTTSSSSGVDTIVSADQGIPTNYAYVGTKIVVRVVSAAASSGNCAVVNTDAIKLILF